RIWIEGLRIDSLMFGPIRMAQFVSLVGIALGAIGLVWTYGLGKRLPDTINPGKSPERNAPSS
ncbi:MAG: prolipoprotein diacylglyceryl transferase family protein, partial [Cyanobacteria bacterium P01_C01_bin.121]